MYPLQKVISGGQTGVDQAALAAAYKVNLDVGGYAPKGYMTLEGPRKGLLGIKYGLVECDDPGYKYRTWQNVKQSDATLRLAYLFLSPGEVCTKSAIDFHRKPYLDIEIDDPTKPISEDHILTVCEWIGDYNIRILNVAGNSQQTAPGIYLVARNFLWKCFMRCVGRRH